MADTQLEKMTSAVPKVMGQSGHAVMDYLAAGTLLAAGFALRRQNPAASRFAFINGAAVLGTSMMTDYPGGLWPVISFKTHGMIDVMQAAMMAAGPALLGFGAEPEAQLFHGQAALEAGVVATTDWAE